MKVKELVELACDIDKFYIINVWDLEMYFPRNHDELEVRSYSIRIDREVRQNTVTETVTMIMSPDHNKVNIG